MKKMKKKQNLVAILIALLVGIGVFAQADKKNTTILITNAQIFDGENEALSQGNILIVNNLIKTISTSSIKAPKNTTVIDAKGKFLMPGLIDVHWHTTYAYTPAAVLMMNQGDMAEVAIRSMTGAKETLMRGFTTVRDPGGNPFAIKKLIDAGLYTGHRILPSGPFMSQTSGHADFHMVLAENPRNSTSELSYWERNMMAMIADGVPEVRKRTREILKYGATQIKITTGGGVSSQYDPLDVGEFSLDEIKAVVEEAENFNTYVLAHVMTDAGIRKSIEGGVKCIEHGFFASDETLELMKEKGVWLSPQAMFNEDMKWDSPVSQKKWDRVTDAVDNVYKKAKKIGVKVAFGTDQLLDASKAWQQSLYLVRMGTWFSNYEVLKMVTSDNASLLEMSGPRHPYQDGPLGKIVEGAYADLIIIDGNPMENLEVLNQYDEKFQLIMKDGKVFKNTLK